MACSALLATSSNISYFIPCISTNGYVYVCKLKQGGKPLQGVTVNMIQQTLHRKITTSSARPDSVTSGKAEFVMHRLVILVESERTERGKEIEGYAIVLYIACVVAYGTTTRG